jgi:REP element-mobilizing transposase RayT
VLSRVIERAVARVQRAGFGVVHSSIQADHIHLMVEAETGASLSKGMRSLAIRIAKAVNRALARRGKVWGTAGMVYL